MLRVKHMSNRGLAVLLTSTLTLTAAVVLADQPGITTIPDQFLDRIRGSNPMVHKEFENHCTEENIRVLNLFDPPGGPPTAVSANKCEFGFLKTTICILCKTNAIYAPHQGGGPPGIVVNPAVVVDCGLDKGGIKGKCELTSSGEPICAEQESYSCDVIGADYNSQ